MPSQMYIVCTGGTENAICNRTCGVTNDTVTGAKAERNLTCQVKAGSPPVGPLDVLSSSPPD